MIGIDRNGNFLWERIFYDQEELKLPESGINKVVHFNSIAEASNGSIVIGGRVIHKFLSAESNSDILFAVLDSSGCIYDNCSRFQDITRFDEFISSEKTWTEGYEWNAAKWNFRYTFDTIPVDIDGNTYYELLRADSESSEDWSSSGSWLRNENGRVFEYGSGNNQIIYDFNLVEGDTFHMGNENVKYDFLVLAVDSISLLNGDLKKRWILQPLNPEDPIENTIWVEGIGNLRGLLSNFIPWSFDWINSTVLCVYWMNNKVYDDPNIETCWFMSTSTNEIGKEDLIVVPNPAIEEITLVGLENEIESVYVYNSFGNFVFQGQTEHIILKDFPAGYYFIIIKLKSAEIRTIGFAKM